MFKEDIRKKRILITGVNGFIGRHLFESLSRLGANVYGISKHEFKSNTYKVDILDFKKIEEIVVKKKINICYHLAGESVVESGQENPFETFKINIEGALNVLEIGRRKKLERIIIASSSHVYGTNKVPYLENYIPQPSRPYETSKACIDLIAQSYVNTYDLPVVIPRFVNIYGPGDLNFTRLIPKIIKQVLTQSEVYMWGGSAIRDFLYIDDAIDAYIKLAGINIETIEENRILNFGGGNTTSIREIVEKIVNLSDKSVRILKTDEQREDEIKSQYVSWEKAHKVLGWEPKTSLTDGLKKTLDWYSDYLRI